VAGKLSLDNSWFLFFLFLFLFLRAVNKSAQPEGDITYNNWNSKQIYPLIGGDN
jgi:hypothetical protein